MNTFKGSRLGVTTISLLDILLSLRLMILARRCSSVGCLLRWRLVRGDRDIGVLSSNLTGPAGTSGNIDVAEEERGERGASSTHLSTPSSSAAPTPTSSKSEPQPIPLATTPTQDHQPDAEMQSITCSEIVLSPALDEQMSTQPLALHSNPEPAAIGSQLQDVSRQNENEQ